MTTQEPPYLSALERWMRQLRTDSGLSQATAARRAGRSTETIRRLEGASTHHRPQADTLAAALAAYNVDLDDAVSHLIEIGADSLAAEIAEIDPPNLDQRVPRAYDFVVHMNNGIEVSVEIKTHGLTNARLAAAIDQLVAQAIMRGRPDWEVRFDLSPDASLEALERELQETAQRHAGHADSTATTRPGQGRSVRPTQAR